MIRNHKLLIDQNCPMCRIYGKLFTRMRLVDQGTIEWYQEVDQYVAGHIDMDKAKSEIAFFNTGTKKTSYGIDAFIEILSQGKGWIRRILNVPGIYHLARLIYFFISYNRHVIAGPAHSCDGRSCTPPLNVRFRIAYLFISALITGIILSAFFAQAKPGLYPQVVEYAVCFGQLLWQAIAVMLIAPRKFWDYLGNMSTVSLIGALLLLPALAIGSILDLHLWYFLISFALVVMIMLKEHLSRSARLGIPVAITLSWIGYRLLVLLIISKIFIL